MKQVAALLLVMGLSSGAFGTSKAYDVVPFGGCVAQTTMTPNEVIQYYRNTLDSLTAIWLWVGDTIDTSSFKIEIRDSVVGTHRVAWNPGQKATRCWAWLKLDLLPDPVYKPVRGRTYKITVTRPTTGAAISYAYDPRETTYAYGCLVVGNQAHPTEDLAAMAAA